MSQENGPPENASWNDDDVARNQRITAIRELAGSEQVTSMRAANSPMPRASADKRRWPALLIALVVVLALVDRSEPNERVSRKINGSVRGEGNRPDWCIYFSPVGYVLFRRFVRITVGE